MTDIYITGPNGKTTAINQKHLPYYLAKGWKQASQIEIEAEQRRVQTLNTPVESVYFDSVGFEKKDGYSTTARLMQREMLKQGIYLETQYTGQDIGLLYHEATNIDRIPTQKKIIYTMFESDDIPHTWVTALKKADYIIVPSKFVADTFLKHGIKSTIIPLGYDNAIFRPKKREIKREVRKDFVFLHYNAFNIRKGFVEIVKSFAQEFETSEPVKLVLKTIHPGNSVHNALTRASNIKVIRDDRDQQGLADLLHQADCFLFPSRGEGFGMPPLEAAATGLPVITVNAHGIAQYYNSQYFYCAKIKDTCPGIYLRFRGDRVGNMVVADIDDLRKKMRYVYEHEKLAKEKGQLAAKYATQFTAEKQAEKLKVIIDVVKKQKPKHKKAEVMLIEQIL